MDSSSFVPPLLVEVWEGGLYYFVVSFTASRNIKSPPPPPQTSSLYYYCPLNYIYLYRFSRDIIISFINPRIGYCCVLLWYQRGLDPSEVELNKDPRQRYRASIPTGSSKLELKAAAADYSVLGGSNTRAQVPTQELKVMKNTGANTNTTQHTDTHTHTGGIGSS